MTSNIDATKEASRAPIL